MFETGSLYLFLKILTALLEARAFIQVSDKRQGKLYIYAIYLGLALKIDKIAGRLALEAHSPEFYALYFSAVAVGLRFIFGMLVVRAKWFASLFAAVAILALRDYADMARTIFAYMTAMIANDTLGSVPSAGLLGKLSLFFYLFVYWTALRLVFKKWWPREIPGNIRNALITLLILLPALFALRRTMAPIYSLVASWGANGFVAPADVLAIQDLLALSALFMASFLALWFANRKMNAVLRVESAKATLENQEIERRKAEAKTRYETYRTLRTNANDKFLAIAAMLRRGGREEEALPILRKIAADWEAVDYGIQTGNGVVDMIVGEKYAHADSNGIRTSCEISVADWSGFDDADLAAVISNILDNAIAASLEHSIKDPVVDFRLHRSGDIVDISLVNSYKGDGEIKEGRGLALVRSIADKCRGELRIDANRETGRVTLALTLRAA